MRALVLSGGGLFGAWQAGAWASLAGRFQPELIVGASVGSLNGYAIACGDTPEMLREMWLHSSLCDFSQLDTHLERMTAERRPRIELAVVVTERGGKIRVLTAYDLVARQKRDYFRR